MSTPPLTIAVNNRNDGKYLPEVLESIRAQTHGGYQPVGIDAGSTDDSLDVYARYHVPVIHVGGDNQPRSVNRALSQSESDFFCWINADDRYEPEFVEGHLDAFAAHPEVEIVHSWWYTFYDRRPARPVHKTPALERWIRRGVNYICHPTTMIRRRLLDRIGHFDESFEYVFDMEFWVRAWKSGARFHQIPGVTAGHRVRPDNLTHTRAPQIRAEMERVRRMHFGDLR